MHGCSLPFGHLMNIAIIIRFFNSFLCVGRCWLCIICCSWFHVMIFSLILTVLLFTSSLNSCAVEKSIKEVVPEDQRSCKGSPDILAY